MIKFVLSKLHIWILLYAVIMVYMNYEEHEQRLVGLNEQIPVMNRKIRAAQKEKKQLTAYYKQEEKEKAKIEKVAREIEKLQKQLPSTISDTEDLQFLTGLAKKLNLKDVFLSPLDEENKGFYFTKDYRFKGRGTFLQFLIFFEKIEVLAMNEKLLNIGAVKFIKPEERQKGRFQLIDAEFSVQAYRYNPQHKEDRGLDEIDKIEVKKNKGKMRKKK